MYISPSTELPGYLFPSGKKHSIALSIKKLKGIQAITLTTKVKAPIAAGDVKPRATNPAPIPNLTPVHAIACIISFEESLKPEVESFAIKAIAYNDDNRNPTPTIPPATRGDKPEIELIA
ncbi:hypothetical protein [Wolbachia endosymbiont (group B) of Protocalliphora azurea]|uniref:hypothetical protein n=1 Tax=Wolbachia endosymbiont (group B) of Protocalliphora azurea TaxID=2954051 RepID=UPI002230E75E|nr:hypothetical protein [Wolbachia endosymbiont (group B) of Protocalliphora azurea]